jgi:hypothetical protein
VSKKRVYSETVEGAAEGDGDCAGRPEPGETAIKYEHVCGVDEYLLPMQDTRIALVARIPPKSLLPGETTTASCE